MNDSRKSHPAAQKTTGAVAMQTAEVVRERAGELSEGDGLRTGLETSWDTVGKKLAALVLRTCLRLNGKAAD